MNDDACTILLVEDDEATRTFLADNLTADGYEMVVADTAHDGLRLLESRYPDLALIDLGLPDASGYDLIRRVREADGDRHPHRPEHAAGRDLAAGREELDRVRGFERGCDDYVCKPFSYPELRGRVAALLRRANQRRSLGRLRVGDLEIDPPSREVTLRGDRHRAVAEGVRPAAHAGRRADARVHEGGAAALDLGLSLDGHDAHARLARLPPAPQARRPRRRVRVNVWGVGYRLVDGPARMSAARRRRRAGRSRSTRGLVAWLALRRGRPPRASSSRAPATSSAGR